MVIFTGLWTTRLQDPSAHPHEDEHHHYDEHSSERAHRRVQSHIEQPRQSLDHRRVQSHYDYTRSVLFGGMWRSQSLRDGGGSPPQQLMYGAPSSSSYGTIDGHDENKEEDDGQPSLTSGDYTIGTDWSTLRMCGIYTLVYLVIAVVAYSFVFESWTIIDSLYFAVSTFTTVGYGDLGPTTEAGQIFTILFAIYGVIILGIFIGIVGHAISEGQAKAIRQLKRGRQQKLLKALFRSSRKINSSVSNAEVQESWFTDHITLMDDITYVCRTEMPEILLVVLLASILGVREGWSFTSTMYFAIMSASTTGYGDYTPQTQIDKLYCIFFLPLSVAVFGEVLGRIASIYIQRQIRKAEHKFLQRSITLCDLRRMDANGDNQVDMEEFLTCK